MPIYTYRCQQCGEEFDKLRPLSERDAPVDCPDCGSPDVERAVAQFGIGAGGACSVGPGPST
jgi:putative FmdB family regulatory protein